MGNNTVKNVILGVVAVGLVGMSIAYASLSQQLKITTTAKVKGSAWKVQFQNASPVVPTGSASIENASMNLTGTTVSGSLGEMKTPGDSLTYVFEVANNGDIDAELANSPVILAVGDVDGVTCSVADSVKANDETNAEAATVCGNITYTLKYTNAYDQTSGSADMSTLGAPTNGDALDAGMARKVELKIVYNADATSVPSEDILIDKLNASFSYAQKTISND